MNNRINSNNPSNPLHFEVRKVQQQRNGRSLMVTLPTNYTRKMELKRGDLLKMFIDTDDKSLVCEKVDLTTHQQGGV
jgi:antitoxin component of MazEF toxin-antitoxin module